MVFGEWPLPGLTSAPEPFIVFSLPPTCDVKSKILQLKRNLPYIQGTLSQKEAQQLLVLLYLKTVQVKQNKGIWWLSHTKILPHTEWWWACELKRFWEGKGCILARFIQSLQLLLPGKSESSLLCVLSLHPSSLIPFHFGEKLLLPKSNGELSQVCSNRCSVMSLAEPARK